MYVYSVMWRSFWHLGLLQLNFNFNWAIGLPWSTVTLLQGVQNAAARLVLGLPPRDHVNSTMKELHWLPVHYCIQFKLALLVCWCSKQTLANARYTSEMPWRWRVKTPVSTVCALPTPPTSLFHEWVSDILANNIIFCDICYFRPASLRILSLKGIVNC